MQHLALPVAAALTYHQIMGRAPDPTNGFVDFDRLLNDVAHAITNVVPIYAPDGESWRQLLPAELMNAQFRRGATVLILADDAELRGLTVRRGDMNEAVAVLRSTHASFQ
jgi:hypothetical protein